MASPLCGQMLILCHWCFQGWWRWNLATQTERQKQTEAIWYSQTSRTTLSHTGRTSVSQLGETPSLAQLWQFTKVQMRETESVNNLSETGRCVWEGSLMERGKSITGKLKLLILLDLQPIKIYHACLHVGMVYFLTYLHEQQDNAA
jgi:hypothetical protein